MPIYEYECARCGHYLEALQKLADKPLRECPECGKHSLKRLVSAPLFRLAGSGWYETDFKSDKEAKRNLAGFAVWGAGLIMMQGAGLANRTGLLQLGQTITWFSIGVNSAAR